MRDEGAGGVPDGPAVEAALARLGYDAFRPGQREAIETLLSKNRLLLVAPTGGGKSLVYQLPATLLRGTTIVVSPLIALMHDQVRALNERGVAATYVSSSIDSQEVRRRLARTAAGEFALVYLAPERLAFPGFRALLQDTPLALVAIDEAHCISEWGHDFRPEYLQIGAWIAERRPPRVMACTATATPVVRDEIVARLGIGADTPQIVRGFARPNLILRAAEVSGARERALHVDAQLDEAVGAPGRAGGVAIVYAPTRRAADEEGARLASRGWRAAVYHAGLDAADRERTQRAFSAGEVDVVAATVAFGMGIDRPDVRTVIHLAPPGSIDAYYQEVGRAGRDGAPAWGLLLTGPGDMALRRRILEANEGMTPERLEHKWELYLELMRWVEGGSCRHDAILRYFGDEAETLSGCGKCDVCEALGGARTRRDLETATLVVRQALSGVARVHDRFGATAAVRLLAGRPDARLERTAMDRTKTFGVLRDRGERWITTLIRRLVTAGYVEFTTGDRPVVRLTDAGRAVMRGDRQARVLLPADRPADGPATRRHRGRERAAVPSRRSAAAGGRAGAASPTLAPAESADQLDPAAERLFETLRAWRMAHAAAARAPAYAIATDRSLREIAVARPRTTAALRDVYGIGPAKAEKYGAELIAIVAAAATPGPPGATQTASTPNAGGAHPQELGTLTEGRSEP